MKVKEHYTYEFSKMDLDTLIARVAKQAGEEASERTASKIFARYRMHTKKEVADILGVSAQTISNWVRQGKIKEVQGLITGAEIERFQNR